jgi:hypothetical protein
MDSGGRTSGDPSEKYGPENSADYKPERLEKKALAKNQTRGDSWEMESNGRSKCA